jgi:ATP-dependent DNA helicase RecG
MAEPDLPEKTRARLQALVDHQDGFKIARMDLEQRGQGEFLGPRQAGLGELDPAQLLAEPRLLEDARRATRWILERDPRLSLPENAVLHAVVTTLFGSPGKDLTNAAL